MRPSLEIGPFTILDFPTHTHLAALPTTVHTSLLGDHQLLNRTTDVAGYERYWDDAHSHALDQAGTLHLITDTFHHAPGH